LGTSSGSVNGSSGGIGGGLQRRPQHGQLQKNWHGHWTCRLGSCIVFSVILTWLMDILEEVCELCKLLLCK
jgi:hypothetical protein